MGLNAVVYRNRAKLNFGDDESFVKFYPKTGEIDFSDVKIGTKWHHDIIADDCLLGNVALIASLRAEISELLGPECLMIQKVVYNGTHSGDVVPLELLDSLAAEVAEMRKVPLRSQELLKFLASMSSLIESARDENNPILFE